MAFVPLTDEEKRILSGEEPEEKSPDVGTGGLFGGINISSIPEVAEARERIERESAREPFDIPENPFAIDQSPSSPRLSAYKMLEDLPEPAESFQGAERLNMEGPGGGTIIELSPQEKAIAEESQGYSPSTLFLGKRFREAYSFGDPEAYAEDVKRSMATGIPMHMLDDAEMRQAADMRRNWEMNLDGLTKLPPALKNWLSIPGRMELARDDISTLAQLADILNVEEYQKNTSRVVQGYMRGSAGADIARIGWRDIWGVATPEELAMIPDLEQQAALNSPLNPSHWDDVVAGLGYMFGQRGRQLGGASRGAIKYGLAAAGTALLFGQAPGLNLLPEEAITVPVAFGKGASIGWNIGGIKEGLILETGSAYHEFSQIKDENGDPLPRELAVAGALLYGIPASMLEMASFSTLTKWVPGVKGMFSREGVGMLLKTPSVRNAILTFMKEYGTDLTFEASQEAVQQLWQIAVGNLMGNRENERRYQEARAAQMAADPREGPMGQAITSGTFAKFMPATLEEALADAGNEFVSSMKTFAASQLPGSFSSFNKNLSSARRAQAMQRRFTALGDVLSTSKLAKRFGPAVSEVIGELTKNGPIEEIGINARVFSETLEQAGEDPAAIAKELGISEETLSEARALDGDVWVPTGTYAEKIAGTEMHGKIAQDIRLGGPEELTAREAETVLAKQQEDLAAAVEEAEAKIAESGEDLAAVNEVKTSLKEQLDTLGLKWLGTQASEAYSTLWANMALQASKRWGMTVKEWTDRINLTVEKDDSGAVRVVGKKKSAAGVSVLPGMAPAQLNEDPGSITRAKENIVAAERGEIDNRAPLTVSEVVTGSGTAVQTQFRLAEADELVASNTATFSPNEAYPAELQPRKRDRVASVAQVEGILSNLDPERLGESRMASDGAPIVGSDMVVESGNGRVLALQLMYGRGEATAATAKEYRSWLKSNAGRFGLQQAEIEGMKAPVLVRERTSDVDRVNFVKEANVSSVAAMSASETARSDAEKMSEGLLSIFDPSRDILSTENIPFIREFLAQVVPSNEWGGITTATGALSKSGLTRLQNALAARAYGDAQVLERMAESEDDNIRNITKALIQAAPALSVMEDRIARGVLRKGYSLSSFISAAVNQLSVLRERGETVDDYLAQQTMFADAEIAPEAKRILGFLDKNKRAPARIAGALAGYARLVEDQGNPNQQNLFGEEPLGRMDLWDAAESSAVGTTYEQAAYHQDAQDFETKGPAEGSIPAGPELARQTQIRPATGQALFTNDSLETSASQGVFDGKTINTEEAVKTGLIDQDMAGFLDDMIEAFPESFSKHFEVRFSPEAHEMGTSAYSIHKMGKTLEDALHVVTLFKGGNTADAILGFGRFVHDRALTGRDASIVKATWRSDKTKGKMDRADWFANQFTAWWIQGETKSRGLTKVFRKLMKGLKKVVDRFRGKQVLHPDMEALLDDIVTNGREITDKYFFSDGDFIKKYILGVDPDPKDFSGEGFSDNTKTFTSWDPGNLCPKKDNFIEYIVNRMEKEGKTESDLVSTELIAQWYDDALAEGIEVPCSYCYVEQARRKAIAYQEQGKAISGVRFAMAKTSMRSIPYNGALRNTNRFSDKKIANMNNRGGLRMFSFSDYIRSAHKPQVANMLSDASDRNLSVKAITKVPAFIEDFAWTGITINQSLDAMNPKFGMDWDLSVRNKEAYPNVKIRVVARNMDEFDRFWKLKYRIAADGTIEYLDAWETQPQDKTPQSGLPTVLRADYDTRLAEGGWTDMVDVITPYHHDDKTTPVPAGYEDMVWDGGKMRELRENRPEILERTCCQAGGKCYSEQYGQCKANCGLKEGNLSIPTGTQEQWVAIKSPAVTTLEQSGVLTQEQHQLDTEYLAAVEAGDMDTAQRMVDKAAKEAGYSYHRYTKGSPSGDVPWMMFTVDKESVENAYGNNYYVASDRDAIDIEDLIPDIAEALEEYGSTEFIRDNAEAIADELNPDEIVTSAGSWDDADVVQDVWDRVLEDRGILKVKTTNGLIVMDEQDSDGNPLVKSADPVVKDNKGNVIPLSERFNSKKSDIRYQTSTADTLDAEYLAAVEAGDEAAARQLVDEAAKEAGYGIGPVFHGTNANFNVFDKSMVGNNYDKDVRDQAGIFFTNREKGSHPGGTAEDWARQATEKKGGKERVLGAYLNIKNPFTMSDYSKASGDSLDSIMTYAGDRQPVVDVFDNDSQYILEKAKELGKDGIVFEDTFDGETDGLYVPFDPEQIKSAAPIAYNDAGNVIPLSQRFDSENADIRYQVKGTGPQGKISFGDGEVLIQLTPKANRSTFLHETGHLFLWDLDNLVKSGKADTETLDHWRTLDGWWKDHSGDLAGWIGKSSRFSEEMRARFSGAEGEKIVREALEGRGTEADVKAVQISAQEYFARGFEQYTMEGKSPSVELRRIFDLFRKWLTKIYTALKGVPDVELSDEVRQVMDRLVASEEAIELSELKRQSDKAASAMLGKGVDDITAREYRHAAEKAAAEAKSRLMRVLMREISEEAHKRVEEARRQAEGQILPELLKIPAYRVYDKLTRWLNSTGEKLSTVGLTAEQVMGIPEGVYSAKGGVDLNVAADLLGLESEAELLALLAEAKANPLDDVLKARVDQAVAGVESSMADPEVMESLVEEAILGPERMRLLSLEREILARRIRKLTGNTNIHDDRTLAAREAAMRQQAKAMILGKSMRESITIHKFLAEAKRAARQAFEAAVAGRLEDALEAKDREMLYSALYLEGKKIREEAEKQQRYLKKFWAGRQRLKPLIGEENLIQIQALLERYGFQKEDQTPKKIMSLHDWLKGANAQLGEDLNEQGAGIPVAEWLWEDEYKGRSKGWKELTVTEFRELHEAVKAIEHYGRSRNKLVAQAREQDFHKWKDKLQQNVISVFGKLRPGSMDPNYQGAGNIARFLAAHDRIEFLLRRLDGFADLGTAWQLFFKPVADAEAIEIRKMKEAKSSIEKIFSVYTKEDRRAMRSKTITTMQLDPESGKPLVLSRENVLAMLMNWGALNNREEVVFGYGFDRTVFNRGQGRIHYADMGQYWDAFRQGEQEVEKLFAQVLTKKDYDVAQAVWDLNESYWADVSAMVHSLTGVTPEKVEHLPVRGPNGAIYQGGYYHLAFKPESSWSTLKNSEKAGMKALYEPQGMFAMTRNGHTKARHTGPRGARLLRLELGVEVEHLRDVIHDLHFRPVVRDLNRLLNDEQVKQILSGSIGFEATRQFQPWVHGLANAYRAADNYGEKVVQKIMGNTSAAILGWSMTSALNQVFGWSTVVASLGVRKTAGAMLNFWTHPQNWKEMKEFAFARSPYLQDRVNSFDRDVKAAIEQITANPLKGKWTAIQETFFTVAGLMDMGVSLPAWTAGYEEGIKKFNGDESKAIDYADWVVRSTQNTGAAKDLASIQRGSPVWKAMTMFYTAFGSIFNQMREQYFRGHGSRDLPRIAGFLLFQFVMPALLGDILNRRGPSGDEDPEEIIEWIFTSILQEMSSTLIIVRDIVNAGTSGFDYRMSPIADAGQSIGRLMMDVGKTGKMLVGGDGPDWEKVAYHAVDVAGTFWGIPSKQILRTTRGLVGMVNDPDWSPIDLLLRKPKK